MTRLFLFGCILLLISATPAYAVSNFSVKAFLDWQSITISTGTGMDWLWGPTSFDDGGFVIQVDGGHSLGSHGSGDWWYLEQTFGGDKHYTETIQGCVSSNLSDPVGAGCSTFSILSGQGMLVETTGTMINGVIFSDSYAYYYPNLQVNGTGLITVTIDYFVDFTLTSSINSLAQTNISLFLGSWWGEHDSAIFQYKAEEGSSISGFLKGTLSISQYIDEYSKSLEMRACINSFAQANPIPEPTTGLLFLGGGIAICFWRRNPSKCTPF